VIPIQSPEVPRLAWIIVLVMASLALSRVFACATPFAALATLGALTRLSLLTLDSRDFLAPPRR